MFQALIRGEQPPRLEHTGKLLECSFKWKVAGSLGRGMNDVFSGNLSKMVLVVDHCCTHQMQDPGGPWFREALGYGITQS